MKDPRLSALSVQSVAVTPLASSAAIASMNNPALQARITAKAGVNAVRALLEQTGCAFQEVAQQNDIGKDAYVDLMARGLAGGLCVALQIKSGKSYRSATGDYLLPLGSHAERWRESTVPVFGVVYDPEDSRIRWIDLTAYLRAHPERSGGHVTIPTSSILDGRAVRDEFRRAALGYAGAGDSLSLKLMSSDEGVQEDAVFDAWALGRQDARYFILLRRLILQLNGRALRRAIAALSHLGLHPDILWTPKNWIPPVVEDAVRPTLRWSGPEIAHMLSVIDVEEWGRGTLGQCMDVLLYQHPGVITELRSAVQLLLPQSEELAIRAATLVLSHAKNAPEEMARILTAAPGLRDHEWMQGLIGHVERYGEFSLY
jgi:hypothetical protein